MTVDNINDTTPLLAPPLSSSAACHIRSHNRNYSRTVHLWSNTKFQQYYLSRRITSLSHSNGEHRPRALSLPSWSRNRHSSNHKECKIQCLRWFVLNRRLFSTKTNSYDSCCWNDSSFRPWHGGCIPCV